MTMLMIIISGEAALRTACSGRPEHSVSPEQHCEDQRDVISGAGRQQTRTGGHLLTDTPALVHWLTTADAVDCHPRLQNYKQTHMEYMLTIFYCIRLRNT